jgi:DNA-binding response OmpR family regulator
MGMTRKWIVVVEGEHELAGQIALRLRSDGWAVEVAHNGGEALRKIQARLPDLVLLDATLPDISGTEIAQQLRSDPRTADLSIILMTGGDGEEDIATGLCEAVDDFVTKPLNLSVLAARISTVLRRSSGPGGGQSSGLRFGPIRIDPDRHHVEVNGRPIVLTLTEFRLLLALALARGSVLTRNQLIDQAIGMDAVVTDRTIDVHMTSLRRKLSGAREYLKTIRGVGYRILTENERVS